MSTLEPLYSRLHARNQAARAGERQTCWPCTGRTTVVIPVQVSEVPVVVGSEKARSAWRSEARNPTTTDEPLALTWVADSLTVSSLPSRADTFAARSSRPRTAPGDP